jgi:hypothetical protein
MNHHGMHPNPERSTASTVKTESTGMVTSKVMESIKRNHSSGSFLIKANPLKRYGMVFWHPIF